QTIPMRKRTVTVNDRMQKSHRYVLSAPVGRNFDPEFKPDLTPREMLRLGVFCGKYMTDARREFPQSWFTHAKLAPRGRDCSRNFFGVDAHPAAVRMAPQGLDPPCRPARLVPMVLPLLHGPPHAGGGPAPDPALEGDPPPRSPDRAQLRARRPAVPP